MLTSFFLAFIIALFWQARDRSIDKSEKNQEQMHVLMSVFFWAAFLGFFLKLIFDLLYNLDYSFINSDLFYYFTIFLEELVKAIAIIIWLEMANKRFNEVSDWVIYWVFAALWFIFFENIFYVLSLETSAFKLSYFVLFFQKNVYWFSSHLIIVLFSTFYAISYLKSPTLAKWNRPKPWHVLSHIKLLWEGNLLIWFLYFILSPIIFIINIVRKTQARLSITLFWSFWFWVFIHIVYNLFLEFWGIYSLFVLVLASFLAFVLYRRFEKLDL